VQNAIRAPASGTLKIEESAIEDLCCHAARGSFRIDVTGGKFAPCPFGQGCGTLILDITVGVDITLVAVITPAERP